MYEDLVKRLREAEGKSMCGECGLNLHTGASKKGALFAEAAGAIEELSMKLHGDEAAIAGMKREIERMVVAGKPRWIPVTERLPKVTSYPTYVLVALKRGNYAVDCLWEDEFQFGFTDVAYWMPLPPAPEMPKDEQFAANFYETCEDYIKGIQEGEQDLNAATGAAEGGKEMKETTIRQYQKKPVIVEAVQLDNINVPCVVRWIGEDKAKINLETEEAWKLGKAPPIFSVTICTLEGDMKAMPGDYIIKGVNGEFYPCKPDIFKKTYETVAPPEEEA